MPLFVSDEEFSCLRNDPVSVADKADSFIRDLQKELDTVRAQADAASITGEQTCALLEQKYISLSSDFSQLQSQNAQLQSSLDQCHSELAQMQAQKHQFHLQSIVKDGEIERLTTEVIKLQKSKRQLISDNKATIKSYLDKIVNLSAAAAAEREARVSATEAELARSQTACARLSQEKLFLEWHNPWIKEELTEKGNELLELQRKLAKVEAHMSLKNADLEEMSKKYQDAVDAIRHEKLCGKESEAVLQRVTEALRNEGLKSANLILGIDFTKSNERTGKVSFNNTSLHSLGTTPNPYEKAISIIGKTLAPFDKDNFIPCFGFGDDTTRDKKVFSFHTDHTPCHGFQEVLSCYRKIVPDVQLSGPTSYAPVVEAAMDIVEKTRGEYHVLVIIADGQVTRSVDTSKNEFSPQEEKTIRSIVNASSYPLSIILVGVGDGPWDDMRKFVDKLPACEFDNFQFVNFTDIMSQYQSPTKKETAFAIAALEKVPIQYKDTEELGILGRVTGGAKKVFPHPPPVPYSHPSPTMPTHAPSRHPSSREDERNQVCPICLTKAKDLAFNCGHMTCRFCGPRVSQCPICREPITSRLRVFFG